METKIYYFSTTGNSLAVARALGSGLGGAELIPIPKAMGGPVDTKASRLGFVFPVYVCGLPRMVVEFLKRLKPEGNPYVFAVATCGGAPGRTLLELRGLLRKAGMDLHAGFVCKEGSNTVTEDPGIVRFIKRMSGARFSSGKERLPEMLSVIRDKKEHAPDSSSFSGNCFGGLMHGLMSLAADKLKSTDSSFYADDRCKACRTCERICPQANVRVEGNHPVWHHNCGMCYGCIQWCPQQAIHIANETCRYHNPDIKAEDLLLR